MIHIESNARSVSAQLRRFSVAKALVAWADAVSPTVLAALRTQAPVGRRTDPRTAGHPHMRDRIRPTRTSSGGGVGLSFVTDVGRYPYYVIAGRSGGRRITPKDLESGVLAWVADGGQWRYARAVTQGAAAADPFNRRAWDEAEGAVVAELRAQLMAELMR